MKKNIAIIGFGTAGQRFFACLKKKNNTHHCVLQNEVDRPGDVFTLKLVFQI